MKVLNFGSLNLDHFYSVDHFVRAGETLASSRAEIKAGGKGLNQSVSLARAGIPVYHAGCAGKGGEELKTLLEDFGVNTRYIRSVDTLQGSAFIQVIPSGENAIILSPGSNACVTKEQAEEVLRDFETGDILVLQNEISCLDTIISLASEKGMRIILNPSPFNEITASLDLSRVSWIFVNETEGYALSGKTEIQEIFEAIHERYPELSVLLTLGSEGSAVMHVHDGMTEYYRQEAYPIKAVDTTGAGDTYTGYFIAGMIRGYAMPEAMRMAGIASGIACTREGAAAAIPAYEEVLAVFNK